jgi:hypothetical protein
MIDTANKESTRTLWFQTILNNDLSCQHHNSCSAPLCPLDNNSIGNSIWYPNEEICHLRACPDWVKVQRAIKRVKPSNDRYFTVDMLKTIDIVRRGIKGISPDLPYLERKQAEQAWRDRHKKLPFFEPCTCSSKANEICNPVSMTN